MTKKILHILVITCLLLSVCVPISFSAYEDNYNASEEAVALLKTLSDNPVFTKNGESNVTRLDFVSAVVSLLKMENSGNNNPCFKDISFADGQYQSVYDALSHGIISENDEFRPNDAVTYNEAVKMVVSAINCGELAEAQGGYPGGYNIVATEKRILKNLSLKEFISYDDFSVLLYNMMTCDSLSFDHIKNGMDYYRNDGKTLLNKIYDIYTLSGIITGTQLLSFDAGYETNSLKGIFVNGERFNCDKKFDDLFGMNCNIYYVDNDTFSKNVVLAFPRNNSETLLNIDDFESTSSGYIVFNKKDEQPVKYRIKESATMVYNGRTVSFDTALFSQKNGSVRLLDNNNDRVYDIVFIEKFTYTRVKNVNVYDRVFEDENSSENDIVFEKGNVSCTIINENGTELMPVEVKKGDILEVKKSLDNTVIRIKIISNTVSGTIESVNTYDDTVLINGTKYKVSEYTRKYYPDSFGAGLAGSFIVGNDNYIAVPYADSESYKYGYMTALKFGKGLDDSIKAKIFSQTNSFTTLTFREKIMVDGAENVNALTFLKNFESSLPQLIMYKTDSKGLIRGIDICETVNASEVTQEMFEEKKEEGNSFKRYIYPKSSFYLQTGPNAAEGYFNITNSVIFMIPEDISDEDSFAVTNYSNLLGSQTYNFETYDVDEYGCPRAVILKGDTSNLKLRYSSGIIYDVEEAINDEGEKGKNLEIWYNGVYKTYFLPNDVSYGISPISELAPGTVVRLSYEGDEITNLIVDFDAVTFKGNTDFDTSSAPITSNSHTVVYRLGKVYSTNGKSAYISDKSDAFGVYNFDLINLKNYQIQTSSMCRFNLKTGRLVQIGADEIRTAKQYGNDADFVLIRQDGYNTHCVFVYEK